MLVLREDDVLALLPYSDAISAMETLFTDIACGRTRNFPLIRSPLAGRDGWFAIKSGCNFGADQLGLKAGGYWNRNPERELDRHQSTVLLLELDTGRPVALVAGNNLTAIRTAAASALSIKHLARPEASRLAILGTGAQAPFQLEAAQHVRPISHVSVWGPTPRHVERLGRQIRSAGLDFEAASTPAAAVREADIIITLTPATSPLLTRADLPDGVHIAAMGADAPGKQELDCDILAEARLFVDDREQCRSIGECQHIPDRHFKERPPTPLGEMLTGGAEGRTNPDEITIFDGTGLALQDLAAAGLALDKARRASSITRIEL